MSGVAADWNGIKSMGLEEKLPAGFALTSVEKLAGYMRKNSLWPATFGLACCAIEMMAFGGGRYDAARFGMEVFRASPRQADLMIVAGRVSNKMAPVLRQIYDQMAAPKWVIAMGETWREDSSNATNEYTRNLIRHDMLPVITSINTAGLNHIAAFADHARIRDGCCIGTRCGTGKPKARHFLTFRETRQVVVLLFFSTVVNQQFGRAQRVGYRYCTASNCTY